jgi:hypothetical protein
MHKTTMKITLCMITVTLLILTSLSSCYYDSEEYLYPQTSNQCDTIGITYSNSIVPLLNTYCLSCHSNSNAPSKGGNIRLEDYADVKARVDDHKLLGSVAYENGYSPMPMGASQLDNCKITTIRLWINAGALNN